MSDLITSQVANIVHEALLQFAEDATIVAGPRIEDDGSGNWQESTQASYTAKAFLEQFTAAERLAGVPENGRKYIILARSVTQEPKPQDKITMRGETRDVVSVEKDPAQATYTVVAA